MTISINRAVTAEIAASNHGAGYPNMVVVDFGRPAFSYIAISMRDLIVWTSARLDGEEGNHRTASLLRAIAEDFYPMRDDEADWVMEELESEDATCDARFDEVRPGAVDARLLGLVDGYAHCAVSFSELLWDGQSPDAALARNASNYLDFEFPIVAVDRYGIRGIRTYSVDLIYWMRSDSDNREMAYQDEEAWLDSWEMSSMRAKANEKFRSDARLRARHGDHEVDYDRRLSGATTPVEQDAILAELGGLI